MLRPPTTDDAERILAVLQARDTADIGRPDFTLEDVFADWVYQRMRAELASTAPAPAAPVRRFDLDSEGPAVHSLLEDAFADIEGNEEEDFATWRAWTERAEPAFRLALDDEAGLVGAAIGHHWEDGVGYVGYLGVAPRGRGRGFGRALLLILFESFRAAGLTTVELSVHGTNAPATGLYESAGMAPDFATERWGLPD